MKIETEKLEELIKDGILDVTGSNICSVYTKIGEFDGCKIILTVTDDEEEEWTEPNDNIHHCIDCE